MAKVIAADGIARFVTGRLRYPTPPPVGTIVGPNDTSEWMVVLGHDQDHTLLGYATTGDLDAMYARLADGGEPHSPAEIRLHEQAQLLQGRRP